MSYCNTSGVSYELQAGAQTCGYALFLMTDLRSQGSKITKIKK